MREYIRKASAFRNGAVLAIVLMLSVTYFVPAISLAGTPSEDARVWVEGDFVVSYDETEVAPGTGALHPAVATTPTNVITLGNKWAGGIHAVWDEMNETTGDREIHYSMTYPEMEGYPLEWTNDEKSEGDHIISEERKGKAPNMGDAVNPSIAVDSQGIIHVVWAQQYIENGIYWEIHYARSTDNGKRWSSEVGQVPGQDILVSRYYGEGQDAEAIPGGPEITISFDTNIRAEEVLHVVWPEFTSKDGQEILYSRSMNGGNSWSGNEVNQIISNPGSWEYARNPTIGATGEVGEYIHVAWSQMMPGKAPSEEIYYTMSDNMGGSWQGEEMIISDPGIPGLIDSVEMATGKQDIHIVWAQEDPSGRAPATGVFYNGDFGGGWEVKEAKIDSYDENIPQDISVAVGKVVGKADPMEVHVVWSEKDEKSPTGTFEVHTSYTPVPMEPSSWSGLEQDNVISWPDDVPGANAQNVSVALTYLDGKWEPRVVWDEHNYSASKNGRVNQNTEIHFDPPAEWTLSTSTVGSGSVSRNPDQPTYSDGTIVTLTANPSVGWSFDHWSGDLSGSTNPDTIYMDSDKSVTAHFVHKDLVANSVSGPASCTESDTVGIFRSFSNTGTQDSGIFRYGLYLSTNSVISTGDTLIYSFQITNQAAGTTNTGTINVGLPMGLTGTYYYGLIADYTYMVTESNEGNNAVASASTVTISPKVFTLTLISSPGGGGSINASPAAPYYYLDDVTLTANPNAGWSFDHWEGDLIGSTNPDTITMDGDKTVTAVFTQNQYTLTISTSGSGSVTKDPDLATYTYGTPVDLTAVPDPGWSFDHWSGDLTGSTNPDTLTIYGDSSVTAYFTEDQYTLSVFTDGSGSVTKDPNLATYTYGTPVQLTAVPDPGWSFSHWTGGLTGSTNPDTITIYGDSSVTAHFTQDQYTLTISTVGSGSVTKDPNLATYTYGQTVTLTANPSFGWEFDHWSGDLAGSANPDTITMYGDSTVWAHFTQIYYDIPLVAGWNLVSVPLIQADTTITSVLSSIAGQWDIVQYFDGDTDDWKTYATFKPTVLNDLTNIDHTMGIWLHTTSACTLRAYGAYPTTTAINLYAGTNMVGYPTTDTSTTVATAFASTGYDKVEVCDLGEPYNLREVSGSYIMQPGEGYLVHVPSDTTWTVDW